MAFNDQIYRQILNEYDSLRANVKSARDKKIKEVYSLIPQVKQIDDNIYKLGLENMNRIFQNPQKKDEYNQSLKRDIKNLQNEKYILLENYGLTKDYDKYEYNCKICSDTGYVENKKCKCFEQKLINASYSQSNMENILKEQNFSTFSFSYYSKYKPEKEPISPLENMMTIHKTCLDFCKNFDKNEKSLLFHGVTGSGKTFLSSCIAKNLIDNGKTVIYTRATRIFSMYEDYKFGRISGDNVRNQLDKLFEVDLLIIDDLGTEQQNKNTLPFLFDILNTRLADGKKVIISTNYTMNELTKVYSSRFTSRIYEYFTPMRFFGEDIRVQKMKESNF